MNTRHPMLKITGVRRKTNGVMNMKVERFTDMSKTSNCTTKLQGKCTKDNQVSNEIFVGKIKAWCG